MPEEEKLPVDFEAKAKMPPSPVARGYPYQLSAKDLMANYKYLMKRIPKGASNGDMLIWSGGNWTLLPAPSGSAMFVLSCTGGVVSWTETEDCP